MGKRLTQAQRRTIHDLHKKGMTYRAIAERIGCSHQAAAYVAKAEAQRAPPTGADQEQATVTELPSPRPADSDIIEPGGALTIEDQRRLLGELLRGAVTDAQALRMAGDTPQAAAQTRLATQLTTALRQVEKLEQQTKAATRPLPPEEELEELGRQAVAHLGEYAERAAEGK